MRKLFSLFVALLATTCLWAQRFQVGDLYYNITSNSVPYTVEVSGAVSSITSAIIPSIVTYNGTTYALPEGRSIIPTLRLANEKKTVTLSGTGTVSIIFRGGTL